jgi:glycosyltransferase involved in cell wall biosynthesis
MTGKPLVVHVHSTEFDRSGERVNQRVYDIERAGMHGAAQVIAVSNMTRNICVSRYGVSPDRITVVYNAVDINNSVHEGPVKFEKDERIVLFLGRITMQKGPEYFVAAAKKVLEKIDNVKFVMAGSGDMFRRVIELAADLGIGHKILFTGFLRGDNVEKIFRMADLFVMPSVSEPFGLVPLEAMSQNVPVIISKQSGVSEVITHALKVDFWDIDEMANKIIAVLRHPPLGETLKKHAHFEIRKFSWHDAARACITVYEKAAAGV